MSIATQPSLSTTRTGGNAAPADIRRGTPRDVFNYLSGLQTDMVDALAGERPEEYKTLEYRYNRTAAANPNLMDYLQRTVTEDARDNPERADKARRALPTYSKNIAAARGLSTDFENDTRTSMHWSYKYGLSRDEASAQAEFTKNPGRTDNPDYAKRAVERNQIGLIAAEYQKQGLPTNTVGIEFSERKRDAEALMHELNLVPVSGSRDGSGVATPDTTYSSMSTAWSLAGRIRNTGLPATEVLGLVKQLVPTPTATAAEPGSKQRSEYGSSNVGGLVSAVDTLTAVASDMSRSSKLTGGSAATPELFVRTLNRMVTNRGSKFASTAEGTQYVRDSARWFEQANASADAAVDNLVATYKLDGPEKRQALRSAYMDVSAAANRLTTPESADSAVANLASITGMDAEFLKQAVRGTDATQALSAGDVEDTDKYLKGMGVNPANVSYGDKTAIASERAARLAVKKIAIDSGVRNPEVVLSIGKTLGTLVNAAEGATDKSGRYTPADAESVAGVLSEMAQRPGVAPGVSQQFSAAAEDLRKKSGAQTSAGFVSLPSAEAGVQKIVRDMGVDPTSAVGKVRAENVRKLVDRQVKLPVGFWGASVGESPEHFAGSAIVKVGESSVTLGDIVPAEAVLPTSMTAFDRAGSSARRISAARASAIDALLRSGLLSVKGDVVTLDSKKLDDARAAKLNNVIEAPVIATAGGESFNLGKPEDVRRLFVQYGGAAQDLQTRQAVVGPAEAAVRAYDSARKGAEVVLAKHGVDDIDNASLTAALGGNKTAVNNAGVLLNLFRNTADPRLADRLEEIRTRNAGKLEQIEATGKQAAARQSTALQSRSRERELDRLASAGNAEQKVMVSVYREQLKNGAVSPTVQKYIDSLGAAPE